MTAVDQLGYVALKLDLGNDVEGTVTLANIKPTATDQACYDIGVALGVLCDGSVLTINRTEKTLLNA